MKTGEDYFFDNEHTWPLPPPPRWDDTVPVALAQCPGCLDGTHTWSEPGIETFPGSTEFGEHTVLRYRCECDVCFGRCDGRQITMRLAATAANTGDGRHLDTAPQPPIKLPDRNKTATTTEGTDVVPEPRRPLGTHPDLVRASA